SRGHRSPKASRTPRKGSRDTSNHAPSDAAGRKNSMMCFCTCASSAAGLVLSAMASVCARSVRPLVLPRASAARELHHGALRFAQACGARFRRSHELMTSRHERRKAAATSRKKLARLNTATFDQHFDDALRRVRAAFERAGEIHAEFECVTDGGSFHIPAY